MESGHLRKLQRMGFRFHYQRAVRPWTLPLILSVVFAIQTAPGLSLLYDFNYIASAPDYFAGYLVKEISPEVSVNEHGNVALIASSDPGPGSNLFVGRGGSSLNCVSESKDARFFGFPQINNQNIVVTRELMGGRSAVRTWRLADEGYTLLASTALSEFTQLTGPTLGNTAEWEFPPLVGFLGRLGDEPFAYFATIFSLRNQQELVSPLAAAQLTSFRAMAADTSEMLFVAQYSTSDDHGHLVALTFDGELGMWGESQIATTRGNSEWSWLGVSPGISDSGKVIAFMGENSSEGPGVYLVASSTSLSTDDVALTNILHVITTNSVIAYDDNGEPITFESFDRVNRVGVLHEELGRAGLADDVVTLCFIATPSMASRLNPFTGKPLLFSDQPGIWCIRVDIRNDLDTPFRLHLNRAPPVAVAQVGDQLFGETITGLALYDPLAPALWDKHGNPRITGPGDHFLAFSATTEAGTWVIRADRLDADGDGLSDSWETEGIDIDRDGVVDLNLPAMEANPLRKDIFLELDWTVPRSDPGDRSWENAPPPGAVAKMAEMFAEAPVTNLDGTVGIVLHVDAGTEIDPVGNPYSINMGALRSSFGGGDLIGMPGQPEKHPDVVHKGLGNDYEVSGVVSRSLHEIKEKHFGAQDKWAREFAFKYAVLADCNGFLYDRISSTNLEFGVARTTIDSVEFATPFPTNVTAGHLLKVVAGRGAGQLRTILWLDEAGKRLVEIDPYWSILPDATSRIAILGGWGGDSESVWYSKPNHHPLGGNDYLVTKGGFGVNDGGWLSDSSDFWRTLAHEIGHTLGLRHGGNNHVNHKVDYESIMNYRYSGTLDSFSGSGDSVFDDWSNLMFTFQNNALVLGNTFGQSPYHATRPDAPDPTIRDYIELVGRGPDLKVPTVSILSPSAGATLSAGEVLQVRLTAADDSGLVAVTVDFDVNGDGHCDGNEVLIATKNPDNSLSAVFPGISGPRGVRKVHAVAEDKGGNQRVTEVSVLAGALNENGAVLQQKTGAFAAQPAASSGGTRQTARIGPIQVPGSGEIMVSLVAAPPARPIGVGTNVVQAAISKLTFRDQERVDWRVSSLVSATQTQSTVYWRPAEAGALYVDLLGPAARDGSGVFTGSLAQDYGLTVTFKAVDVAPPKVGIISPRTNGFVELDHKLVMLIEATDDYGIATVQAGVDVNGDGNFSIPGEIVQASLQASNVYQASFAVLSGPAGTRRAFISAVDTSGHVTRKTLALEVRSPDMVPPIVRITAPEPGARVQTGTAVSVAVESSDNRELGEVAATLDLDGDGSIDLVSETVPAKRISLQTFEAGFAAVSGIPGARMLSVIAWDTAGNTNVATLPITVGGVQTNSVTLTNLNGNLPAQSSQWVGGKRQVVSVGPILLPSAGTLRFVVTATPNCRIAGQTTARYDPVIDQVTLNSKVATTTQSWNAPGSNPAVGTSTIVVTEPGSLSFRLMGAAVYNSWGEFDGSPAQAYTLDVQLEAFDNVPPQVSFAVPTMGVNLELGKPVAVEVSASDAGGLASVLLFLDVNGDGETDGPGEMQAAAHLSGTTYRATFAELSGPPGTRTIRVLATDASLNSTAKSVTVGCGGVGAGETMLSSQPGSFTDNGTRQTTKVGPVSIPGVGRITFRAVSAPNTRQAVENLTRYDTAVRAAIFNGLRTALVPTCNPPGSNPAECVTVWDSPGPGTLEAELVGPAVYNSWGEYSGHPPTTYTLEVLYRPGPAVASVVPSTGAISGGQSVEIAGSGFSFNPTVLFNDVAAESVTRLSASKLTCVTPPGVPGQVTVTVLNSDAEGEPWNYGPPYSLFGRLANGFQYLTPASPPQREGESLLGTYVGRFEAVSAEQPQRQQALSFSIPKEGRVRFVTYAFVPILNPLPGPFENPDDLTYHNESSAVRRFTAADGRVYSPWVASSDLSYPFGPVITETRAVVGKAGAGPGSFVVTGPARWNAFWRQFGDFEMVSAPAQSWSLAVWFASRPSLLSISPPTGSTGGGTLVTITGSNLVDGVKVLFGGVPANAVHLAGPTTLTCRTPPGLRGTAAVELQFADMKSELAVPFRFGELVILDIIPPVSGGQPVTVHILTETGKLYQLQRLTALAENAVWNEVGPPVAGTGGSVALIDPNPASSSGAAFYRIAELH